MQTNERRQAILKVLQQQEKPLSATLLAKEFSVSRQIIVGDIALIRASGVEIAATPRGYILINDDLNKNSVLKRIACNHIPEKMVEELQICVDNGCKVIDVIVEHPVYGQLVGQLDLSSRYDVEQFAKRLQKEKLHSLSELTDGIHLHTLQCPDMDAYNRVCEALKKSGILLTD